MSLFNDSEVARVFKDSGSSLAPLPLPPRQSEQGTRVLGNPRRARDAARGLPSTIQTLPPVAELDPEDTPTIPALPPIPRLTCRTPASASQVEMDLLPEPALPGLARVPAYEALGDEEPAAVEPTPGRPTTPAPLVMMYPTPSARALAEPEPTLKVPALSPTDWTTTLLLPIGAFAAGAVMAALLLLILAPWQGVSRGAVATEPDPILAPVTAPLDELPADIATAQK